jgi:hypothetical protein
MLRSAIARREAGAYGQYSTPVQNGLTPPASGCIGGPQWEVVLARATQVASVRSRLGRSPIAVDLGRLFLETGVAKPSGYLLIPDSELLTPCASVSR